jgi:putative addiction module component (TIGR02574 family)
MSERAKQLSDEARKLTPAERLKVVDEILTSLDESDESLDLLWAKEVEDRLRAYRRGELKALDLDQVLEKYRAE